MVSLPFSLTLPFYFSSVKPQCRNRRLSRIHDYVQAWLYPIVASRSLVIPISAVSHFSIYCPSLITSTIVTESLYSSRKY